MRQVMTALALAFASVLFAVEVAAATRDVNAAKKKVAAYTFVLPGIDCYRTTGVAITTHSVGLRNLLDQAMAQTTDADTGAIKQAAVQGAKRQERVEKRSGHAGYCSLLWKEYGPDGSVFPGLVVKKKSQ